MSTYTKFLTLLALVALFGTAHAVFAQTGGPGGHVPPPGAHGPGAPRGMAGTASTTWARGTTTPESHGSTTPGVAGPDGRAFPGIVTAIASDHFLMSGRGLGNNASTTFTVNVASTTKFVHGSSTASLGDLTVGTKVEVMGTMATSTKTITATRIVFGMGMPGDHGPQKAPPGLAKGLLDKLKSFFGFGTHAGTTTASSGPAAAAGSGDVVSTILQTLFGWMH
jgi:hypothetical protein